MRVALVSMHAGVQYTLATTAFITALADGLRLIDVPVRIIGLVAWESCWRPEALDPFESAAPWIAASPPRPSDAVDANRRGVTPDSEDDERIRRGEMPKWYLELLLERELESFAGGDPELAVIVYPIDYAVLDTVSRVAARRDWKLIVQSCEAMSGSWIDPETRDDYIDRVVSDSDGMWALSDYLADYWAEKGLSRARIVVRPNIVRQSSFSSGPPPRRFCATYLGNLQHREIEYLLEISELVSRRVPAYRLAIYGDAEEARRNELLGMIEARGLSGVVNIERPVQPTEVPRVLDNSDVLVLPRAAGEFSMAGFPNKLGEYLASGRPVVATRVGDIPKYLADGDSAILVQPDDCPAFADALCTVLEDLDLADRIGASGKRVAEGLLASPVVAETIMEFIRALPPRQKSTRAGTSVQWPAGARFEGEARRTAKTPTPSALRPEKMIMHRVVRSLKYTRTGHTRLVALKMLVVRTLELLRLRKPPER